MGYVLRNYDTKSRADFVDKYAHTLGLDIYENKKDIYALEPNEIVINEEIVINPDYENELLEETRTNKLEEALAKAYDFEQNGSVEYKNCVFEMSLSNRHNLDNTQEALEKSGQTETPWNDKNDELVTLTLEDIQYIRLNLILGKIRKLWIVDYPNYKNQILNAETVEEIKAIEIDYTL